MGQLGGLYVVIYLLSIASSSQPLNCTKDDYVQQILPCDSRTQTRSVVYYLNSSTCEGGEFPPKPQHNIPCVCLPGNGFEGDRPPNLRCTPCAIGQYGPGGEIINNWRNWTGNGTVPPEGSGLITYCDISSNYRYIKHCDAWKASADNYTLESGDNFGSRCLVSTLLMSRMFVQTNSSVSFDYRVDSRNCRSGYFGCDGLGFFIDGQQVLQYQGNQFRWVTKTYNLGKGTHTLKWVFRKRCFSYGYSFLDKAFIRSITLVGTVEPNVKCKPCPPGYFGNQTGASQCTACSYFQFQAKEGQTKCDPCPLNTFAMMGASKCIPLPKCTKDDIISAPGNLSTCYCNNTGVCTTPVQEKLVTVTLKDGKGPRSLCNRQNTMITPSLKTVKCRCQPGFEIFQGKNGQIQCNACSKGKFSTGLKCATCKAGHVALPGKHYFLWRSGTLPEGFSASCSGDCTIETGWISAGDHIRTERVVGNVHSELRSPEVEVESDLAKLVFNCSVMCNLTGVPSKPVRGETLAKIENCNLIFQVWKNGSLNDQVNCTSPKGQYVFRHEWRRDGKYATHVYPLKKGRYQFRWTFYQLDDSFSSAFEAKVSNISILGTKSGAARSCTACPPGYYSTTDNTDCKICPNGTSSSAGSDKCAPCQGQTFAAQMGSDRCLPCGSNTKVLPNKDGCDTNGCTFSPAPGVDYDLNALSRPGGSMIKANLGRLNPWGRRRFRSAIIWPYISAYYVNLCTVDHDNSSCTSRDRINGKRVPLPVMACRSSWLKGESIGSVIGYKRKKDIRSGLTVELLHGDKCWSGGKNGRYKTTIDLRCDVTAGVGQPGRDGNFSLVQQGCHVHLVWKSLYACPKCRKQDITRIKGECINGTRNVTILRSIPCWAREEYPGSNFTTEECVTPTKVVTVTVTATVLAFREKVSSKVNKILIGVGVVAIVLLLGVALLFAYKHRTIKYRYLNWISRDKPMSRLEQEDDEDHFIDGDELAYPSNDRAEPFRT